MKTCKPAFGTSEDMNYAVQIKALETNDFFKMPFGRRLDSFKVIKEWMQTAKSDYVGAKGKPTMKAIKNWIKLYQPSEFYAKWRQDSDMWKDDSVEIFFKK